jgi:hypothetical protein
MRWRRCRRRRDTTPRARLFALQQACYQLGALNAPPRQSGPKAVGPAVQAAGVRQPLIRVDVVHYVETISTTLRPYTMVGRTKALRVFFAWLAEQHPDVTHLDQIEPHLAWARYRPWRGKNRSDWSRSTKTSSTCAGR